MSPHAVFERIDALGEDQRRDAAGRGSTASILISVRAAVRILPSAARPNVRGVRARREREGLVDVRVLPLACMVVASSCTSRISPVSSSTHAEKRDLLSRRDSRCPPERRAARRRTARRWRKRTRPRSDSAGPTDGLPLRSLSSLYAVSRKRSLKALEWIRSGAVLENGALVRFGETIRPFTASSRMASGWFARCARAATRSRPTSRKARTKSACLMNFGFPRAHRSRAAATPRTSVGRR